MRILAAPCVVLLLAACAAALPFIPVTPILSTALSARANDDATAKEIVELEVKQDWAGLAAFATRQIQQDPGDVDWWLIFA